MNTTTTIGILGGSFDPVHKAHIELAKAAFKQCALDKLLFIPAKQAPLKEQNVCADDLSRLHMLKLATQHLDFDCEIDTIEMTRDGISYSIDTAKYLKCKYPNSRLIWIIGSDHIGKLAKWKDIDALCEIIEFACAKRPNNPLSADDLPKNAKITFIDFSPIDISSTEIRNDILRKKNLEKFLEPDIISYINKNKLYSK